MRLSTDSRNAAIDAVTARLDGGTLRVLTAEDGDLLAEFHWSTPAFLLANNAVAVSFPLASAVAVASGNPTFAQAVDAAGGLVFDEQVNEADGSGIQIEPAWIEAGGAVVIDSIVYSA